MIARNTAAFLDVAADLLSRGHSVRFRAEGGSMHPTIRGGEAIVVAPVLAAQIRADDVLLYRAGEQRVSAHRVVGIDRESGAAPAFTLRGDAAGAAEERVEARQVLGRVTGVVRQGWGERLLRRAGLRAGRPAEQTHSGRGGAVVPGLFRFLQRQVDFRSVMAVAVVALARRYCRSIGRMPAVRPSRARPPPWRSSIPGSTPPTRT